MWSFWDALMFSTMMATRDYYRDRERNMLRMNQFKQKCMETISDNATSIVETISSVVKKQRTAYMSEFISEGIVQLPMYAFHVVLLRQRASVTKEQKTVIEIFANNLTMPYSVRDFLSATTSDNNVRTYLNGMVGISTKHVGKFWKEFFKSVYRTETEEKVVTSIIEKFATIVMNFAIIGDAKANYAETILQEFMEAVGYQAVQCRSLPQDEIDIYGDVGYIEHYHSFENEYGKVVKLTKSVEEGLPAFEIYPYFCMGVIYQVISKSTRNRTDKASCIDYIMKKCGMHFNYTGEQIVDSMERIAINEDNELGWWITNLVGTENSGLSFWQILATLSGKCKDYNYETTLIPKLCSFLIGMDGELAKQYPMSGFGNIAKPYLATKLEELNDLIDALDDVVEGTESSPIIPEKKCVVDTETIVEEKVKSGFETDYIEFRKALKKILDSSDYLSEITSFNNVMAAVYLYEIMMVLEHLPTVSEQEKIDIYMRLMKQFQLELENEEETIKLYHVVKARVGGWEKLIPSAAIPSEESEIGTFWLFVVGAIEQANLNMKKIIDLLGLHAKYMMSMEKQFVNQYKMMVGFHEKIEEYVQSSIASVPVFLVSRGLINLDDSNLTGGSKEKHEMSKIKKESVVETRTKKQMREDLNTKFRTSWEANIARTLNYCGITWKYEPQYFELDLSQVNVSITPQYLPDFILEDGTIIEVKQNWDVRNAEKMQLVLSQMGDRKVVIVDNDYYQSIQKRFANQIPDWEFEEQGVSNQIHVVGIGRLDRQEFVQELTVNDELFYEIIQDADDKPVLMVRDEKGNIIGSVSKSYSAIFIPKIEAGFKYKMVLKAKKANKLICEMNLQNEAEIILPEIFDI